MKLTLEISDDDLRGEGRDALVALLGGSVLLSILDGDNAGMRIAREKARELHQKKEAPADDNPELPVEEAAPSFRAYGQPAEGRKKRTKDEMQIDGEIDELFARAQEAGVSGLPKAIPTDVAAEDVLAELREMDLAEEDEDDTGFSVDGDDDDGDAAEIMDLDEFRALLTKAMKKLGGAKVGPLMHPYKSATDVPEAERRDYADKVVEAMEEAS